MGCHCRPFCGLGRRPGKLDHRSDELLYQRISRPWIFAVLRYALPEASIRNAGFKIKPYRYADGRDTHALAAWEGSAFQLLGLSLFMQELRNPGWRKSLEALVDIELDFSGTRNLPGFLSEAYSGNGTEYTGLIGIPTWPSPTNPSSPTRLPFTPLGSPTRSPLRK